MDNVKVGKKYKWRDRTVFVRARPLVQAIGENQSPVLACEVLILPDGRIDFSPVSELTFSDDPPHLKFTMDDGKPVAAEFDNDPLPTADSEILYGILVDQYPSIASTLPVITFRRGKNIIGMHIMLVTDGSGIDVPSTNCFAPEKAEDFCRSLYGEIPDAIHPHILVNFD